MAKKEATTKNAAEVKEPAAKKTTTTKKAAAAKAVIAVNAENIGFKAGDVYQALAAAESALSVKEIAKAAKITEEETLLGLGWLFKEGKLNGTEDNKVVLA
jgi:Cdc6-like AAA superfamily ATPase